MKLPNKVTNLTDLAEFLKTLEYDHYGRLLKGFNMQETHSCIGGWARRLQGDPAIVIAEAVKKLAPTIDWEEIDELCFRPYNDNFDGWSATPHQAARAVEILRDTGKCDWERAMKEA